MIGELYLAVLCTGIRIADAIGRLFGYPLISPSIEEQLKCARSASAAPSSTAKP